MGQERRRGPESVGRGREFDAVGGGRRGKARKGKDFQKSVEDNGWSSADVVRTKVERVSSGAHQGGKVRRVAHQGGTGSQEVPVTCWLRFRYVFG